MSDIKKDLQRHYIMSRVHSKNTKPEIKLRKELWRLGFRYRINDKELPGSPDIVLPKYRTAIFIHGCFWHGHRNCKKYTVPKTNTEFWVSKVARNQERDQAVWRQLEAKGWKVIIVWECQVGKAIIQETINIVASEIRKNGELLIQEKRERQKSREEYQKEQKNKKERSRLLLSEIHSKV